MVKGGGAEPDPPGGIAPFDRLKGDTVIMIYNNVLEAVGETPLIRLNRMVDEDSAEVLVKFEALNVGGSIKTRTALNMINSNT